MRRAALVIAVLAFTAASCGGSSDSDDNSADEPTATVDASASGLETVSPDEAATVIDADPDGVVVLDVRTPEEFAEGHLDDAVLIDFYDADFTDQLAELDPDATYVLYCRSGNRSGQTLGIMDDLGFASVSNVDGGILAWSAAGLPVVAD